MDFRFSYFDVWCKSGVYMKKKWSLLFLAHCWQIILSRNIQMSGALHKYETKKFCRKICYLLRRTIQLFLRFVLFDTQNKRIGRIIIHIPRQHQRRAAAIQVTPTAAIAVVTDRVSTVNLITWLTYSWVVIIWLIYRGVVMVYYTLPCFNMQRLVNVWVKVETWFTWMEVHAITRLLTQPNRIILYVTLIATINLWPTVRTWIIIHDSNVWVLPKSEQILAHGIHFETLSSLTRSL